MLLNTCLLVLMWCSAFSFGGEPIRDVACDTKHERDVLDFWPAVAADGRAPVIGWCHGGGFQTGDKNKFEKTCPQCSTQIRMLVFGR